MYIEIANILHLIHYIHRESAITMDTGFIYLIGQTF